MKLVIAIACAGCGAAQSQEQMERNGLARSPSMHHPATGKLDPVPADGFMASFRLESYRAGRICFLGRANIPPEVASNVAFRMESYRTPDEYPARGHVATSREVQILDSQEVELRWKKIELAQIGSSHVYDMQATQTDRSMFNTGINVCFAEVPSSDARYLVLQTDPNDPAMQHHRVGVSWRLVP